LVLVQPSRRADFGTPAQSLNEAGHLQGKGKADKFLAREIEAQAAMLQAPRSDATREYGTLTPSGPA
jgi:hypothetical protein